jgi:hypothetical protein
LLALLDFIVFGIGGGYFVSFKNIHIQVRVPLVTLTPAVLHFVIPLIMTLFGITIEDELLLLSAGLSVSLGTANAMMAAWRE